MFCVWIGGLGITIWVDEITETFLYRNFEKNSLNLKETWTYNSNIGFYHWWWIIAKQLTMNFLKPPENRPRRRSLQAIPDEKEVKEFFDEDNAEMALLKMLQQNSRRRVSLPNPKVKRYPHPQTQQLPHCQVKGHWCYYPAVSVLYYIIHWPAYNDTQFIVSWEPLILGLILVMNVKQFIYNRFSKKYICICTS